MKTKDMEKIRPAEPFIEKILKNKKVRVLFEKEQARSRIAMLVKTARLKRGFTQAKLAERINTSQSVIARLESGNDTRMPSLTLLGDIATACGAELEFGFYYKKAA